MEKEILILIEIKNSTAAFLAVLLSHQIYNNFHFALFRIFYF